MLRPIDAPTRGTSCPPIPASATDASQDGQHTQGREPRRRSTVPNWSSYGQRVPPAMRRTALELIRDQALPMPICTQHIPNIIAAAEQFGIDPQPVDMDVGIKVEFAYHHLRDDGPDTEPRTVHYKDVQAFPPTTLAGTVEEYAQRMYRRNHGQWNVEVRVLFDGMMVPREWTIARVNHLGGFSYTAANEADICVDVMQNVDGGGGKGKGKGKGKKGGKGKAQAKNSEDAMEQDDDDAWDMQRYIVPERLIGKLCQDEWQSAVTYLEEALLRPLTRNIVLRIQQHQVPDRLEELERYATDAGFRGTITVVTTAPLFEWGYTPQGETSLPCAHPVMLQHEYGKDGSRLLVSTNTSVSLIVQTLNGPLELPQMLSASRPVTFAPTNVFLKVEPGLDFGGDIASAGSVCNFIRKVVGVEIDPTSIRTRKSYNDCIIEVGIAEADTLLERSGFYGLSIKEQEPDDEAQVLVERLFRLMLPAGLTLSNVKDLMKQADEHQIKVHGFEWYTRTSAAGERYAIRTIDEESLVELSGLLDFMPGVQAYTVGPWPACVSGEDVARAMHDGGWQVLEAPYFEQTGGGSKRKALRWFTITACCDPPDGWLRAGNTDQPLWRFAARQEGHAKTTNMSIKVKGRRMRLGRKPALTVDQMQEKEAQDEVMDPVESVVDKLAGLMQSRSNERERRQRQRDEALEERIEQKGKGAPSKRTRAEAFVQKGPSPARPAPGLAPGAGGTPPLPATEDMPMPVHATAAAGTGQGAANTGPNTGSGGAG